MYRQGLGDCFLVSITREGREPFRILIDCGVILGTAEASTKMTEVVDDIVATSNGHVDLLLATHQHWDHLSGFIQARASFAKLSVDEVWVAWTEDPRDDLARELRGEREQALAALRLAGAAMTMAGDKVGSAVLDSLLGFFGAAGGTTQDALDEAMRKGKVRYCRPGDPPTEVAGADARIFVLGPPHDAKLIRRTLPSAHGGETYGIAQAMLGIDVVSALSHAEDDQTPFPATSTIPLSLAQQMDFFQNRYWGTGVDAPDWRRIDAAWLGDAADLALALDSATNNTSLVVAVELGGRDVLLFVADAQVGNWESWQDLSFQVGKQTVTGPDLLARTIFYKVGHHGSHNATLREKGLELMKQLELAAIPVNHEMAVKKRWGNIPLPDLVERLATLAKRGVVRIDEDPSQAIPGVASTELYFDISI